MKSLETLLKVAQRRMDELGLEVTRLRQEIDVMLASENAILAREANEVALASQDITMAGLLPAYRARVKRQVAEIRAKMSERETVLAEARDKLTAAYQEKAKFEQLLEQERLRQASELAAKEQAMLDEVAINRAGGIAK
ncbi:MAG TPA: flagellar FliJ family protein [Hyphomonadaceae bacterium]|nr:flagellar FliJ family protein [Hyphomonadaceae bacterium]